LTLRELVPMWLFIESISKKMLITRKPQQRLNPAMKDVARTEVLKLLDAGIIYPISDSE